MKLRIRDNSIRLRLTQSEVEQAHVSGRVRSSTQIAGDKQFDYVLQSSPGLAGVDTQLLDNVLTVRVPESDIARWSTSEEVSILAVEALSDGGQLRIAVEKDFACLAPREGEDEADMFPHPLTDKETRC